MVAGLLAPLRLPERAIRALESLAGAGADIAAIREEVTATRKQTEPLAELMPAIARLENNLGSRLDTLHGLVEALEGNESHLNKTVQQLVGELEDMHKTIHGLRADVERVTDRLPDDDDKRGPMKVARDVLTGNTD